MTSSLFMDNLQLCSTDWNWPHSHFSTQKTKWFELRYPTWLMWVPSMPNWIWLEGWRVCSSRTIFMGVLTALTVNQCLHETLHLWTRLQHHNQFLYLHTLQRIQVEGDDSQLWARLPPELIVGEGLASISLSTHTNSNQVYKHIFTSLTSAKDVGIQLSDVENDVSAPRSCKVMKSKKVIRKDVASSLQMHGEVSSHSIAYGHPSILFLI